jgi:hypothetical protein
VGVGVGVGRLEALKIERSKVVSLKKKRPGLDKLGRNNFQSRIANKILLNDNS